MQHKDYSGNSSILNPSSTMLLELSYSRRPFEHLIKVKDLPSVQKSSRKVLKDSEAVPLTVSLARHHTPQEVLYIQRQCEGHPWMCVVEQALVTNYIRPTFRPSRDLQYKLLCSVSLPSGFGPYHSLASYLCPFSFSNFLHSSSKNYVSVIANPLLVFQMSYCFKPLNCYLYHIYYLGCPYHLLNL